MTKISETIVFFGSGPVAAKSLQLLAEDFNIEAIITKPRPPHHKGDYPVLEIAEKLNLPVQTVSNRAELSKLFTSSNLVSRLGIVIDFGIIINQDVIDYFPLGILNSHFSLLPRWRGADPISFAILSGDKQTGISLMLINDKLDEGDLLMQSNIDISNDSTTPLLTGTLIELSHRAIKSSLPNYLSGKVKLIPQSGKPTYSRKLTKQDSVLDFSKPAEELAREIRAFMGWPRSRAKVNGIDVILTASHIETGSGEVGRTWQMGRTFGFYTAKDILVIDKLIPSGKKEMLTEAFLAGYSLN